MLDYALKLTRSPSAMTEGDVEKLRRVGFADRAILDICQVGAYFNFVNRLADGLGAELEAHWREEDLILTRTEFTEARGRQGG